MTNWIRIACLLAVSLVGAGATAEAQSTIPEKIAAADCPKQLVYQVPFDVPERSLDELLAGSDLAVQGKIYRRNSYLSEDGYHVYSNYDIVPSLVMMDKSRPAGRPSVGSPLVIQVYGGDLMVGGTHVTVVNDSFTGWKDGAEMLLFLSAADAKTGRRLLYGESAGAFVIEANGALRSVIKRGAVNRAIHGAQRSTVVGQIHEKLKR